MQAGDRKKIITIAYATEEDYTKCTIISMLSILQVSEEKVFYNFYIIVDHSFSDDHKKNILKCLDQYKTQCKIKFKIIGNVFDNARLCIDFIKKPTYFRLLLPQLLNEEKCLYLDSDTVICKDLQILFNVKMDENYVAGVKAPVYVLGDNENYCRRISLTNMQQYINAGVLLMNLEQMRKDNVVKKFLDLLPLYPPSQDQDIINCACYGKITFLPFEFNVMTKYAAWKISDYENIFSSEELKRAWNDPHIIHYADRIKPWNNFNCALGEYWWMICRKSLIWDCCYKDISDKLLLGTFYSAGYDANTMVCKKTTVLFDLLYKKRIIIFGAGNRAAKFIRYLKKQGIMPEYVLVSDSDGNPEVLEGIMVKDMIDMEEKIRGKTIIIATSEKFHMEILLLLQNYKFKEIIPLSDVWQLDESIECK